MESLVVHDRLNSDDAQEILQKLLEFNRPYGGGTDWRELTITARDDEGRLLAGLNGYTSWGWLFVKLLWVSESHRGSGLGRRILLAAEEEAVKRGCTQVWLDTFSFQAPGFYEKQGYREFGRLENFPVGHSRSFFTKSLV